MYYHLQVASGSDQVVSVSDQVVSRSDQVELVILALLRGMLGAQSLSTVSCNWEGKTDRLEKTVHPPQREARLCSESLVLILCKFTL